MKKIPDLRRHITQELLIIASLALISALAYSYYDTGYKITIFVLTTYIAGNFFRIYRMIRSLSHTPRLEGSSYGLTAIILTLLKQYRHHDRSSVIKTPSHQSILMNILSALPSATIILNQRNEIVWANHSALYLLGIDDQKDRGIKIDTLLRQTKFIKKLTKGDAQEFEMTSPLNSEITLLIQFTHIDEKKRLLLAHNISAHSENQRSKKTFIANASHELRTPLTIIAGYLEFIHSSDDIPKSLLMPIEKSLQQAQRMNVLIDDLLYLSRLENRSLTADSLSTIDLKSQLNHIIQSLQESGKLNQYHLSYSAPEGLSIQAVAKELESVCYNLITNALKYSDADTKIIVSWEQLDNATVKFSVIDQGIGIAPEHLAHLTERFYRVDKGRSRSVGGTGLGLSITKHIIERHHGKIEITSQLGKGSIFAVMLPIKQHSIDQKSP